MLAMILKDFLKVMAVVAIMLYGAIMPFALLIVTLLGQFISLSEILVVVFILFLCFLFSSLLAFIFIIWASNGGSS
jgi:hypothetical protein